MPKRIVLKPTRSSPQTSELDEDWMTSDPLATSPEEVC